MDNDGSLMQVSNNPPPGRSVRLRWRSSYADDTLGSDELDELVRYRSFRVPLSVGLNVPKVPNMASLVGRSAMVLPIGID
jgi:hypothetical protein